MKCSSFTIFILIAIPAPLSSSFFIAALSHKSDSNDSMLAERSTILLHKENENDIGHRWTSTHEDKLDVSSPRTAEDFDDGAHYIPSVDDDYHEPTEPMADLPGHQIPENGLDESDARMPKRYLRELEPEIHSENAESSTGVSAVSYPTYHQHSRRRGNVVGKNIRHFFPRQRPHDSSHEKISPTHEHAEGKNDRLRRNNMHEVVAKTAGASGDNSSSGPHGVPLSTWALIAAAVIVGIILCIIARVWLVQVCAGFRTNFSHDLVPFVDDAILDREMHRDGLSLHS